MEADICTATITARRIPPDESGRSTSEIADAERKALALWSELDDEKRQVIVLLVSDILVQMLEKPADWLPTSLEPVNGDKVEIFLALHMTDIDSEVLRRRVETERMINNARQDLVAMAGEFTDGEIPAGS